MTDQSHAEGVDGEHPEDHMRVERRRSMVSIAEAMDTPEFAIVKSKFVGRDIYDCEKDDGEDIVLGHGQLGQTRLCKILYDKVVEDVNEGEGVNVKQGQRVSISSTYIEHSARLVEFLKDMATLKSLKHENIVGFLAFTLKESRKEDSDTKWVSGGRIIFENFPFSLSNVMYSYDSIPLNTVDHMPPVEQLLTADTKTSIAKDVAQAMAYLHARNEYHGDLRPQKILLSVQLVRPEAGAVAHVHVGAKVRLGLKHQTDHLYEVYQGNDDGDKKLTGHFKAYVEAHRQCNLHVEAYMHPTQRKHFRTKYCTSKLNDIHAFGVTLYEMCTMRRPSGAIKLAEAVGTLSPSKLQEAAELCASIANEEAADDAFAQAVLKL